MVSKARRIVLLASAFSCLPVCPQFLNKFVLPVDTLCF
jgi:hypothetical protein